MLDHAKEYSFDVIEFTIRANESCFEEFECRKTLMKVLKLKDGAYYCYCAYDLRISRYSDFLSPMHTNTGIFLRGLKLFGESRS